MIKKNGDNVFAIASSNNQCQGGRSAAAAAAVSLCPGIGAATKIPRATTANRMTPPDAHNNAKEANIAISTFVEKWKNKYEESERKHKACLLKSEKARREYDDLSRRHNILQEERNQLAREVETRENELSKLRVAAEQLFQEYQQLLNQSQLDQGVMQKVMKQASEWYKQNKQLKRRSTALLQALPSKPVDIDFTDSNDNASDSSSNEEVEFLKATVSELAAQLAATQAELQQAQQAEFLAHELHVSLEQELEVEREKSESLKAELDHVKSELERHGRVSKLLLQELEELRVNADTHQKLADNYKSEASQAKKRVRVLTHQSALLSAELSADERARQLLLEVDDLKLALENQALAHTEETLQLQLKLAEKREETDELLWEEKIKLAEEDAERYRKQAESAERKLQEYERRLSEMERRHNEERKPQKKSNLMSRISYFENGGEAKRQEIEKTEVVQKIVEEEAPELPPKPPKPDHAPSPPAPPPAPHTFSPPAPPPPPQFSPPLPPPPPPPPPAFTAQAEDNMATLLQNKQGTLKKTSQNGGGAIDAIVDQIKGGKFHLKSTRPDMNYMEKRKEDQPEAVKEMLAILGTLRKRRSVHRGLSIADADK